MERPSWEEALAAQEAHFEHWEKVKDIVDQLIDFMLNYRQSGHPGGSRSKVHALVTLMLSGAMRWDIRNPDKRFSDRFVLAAGHTIPLVYATLATLNEALRIRHGETGDDRYLVKNAERWQLTWEDLLKFRRRGGLSGHAEFEGKTLFLKFNTGPSGHGLPAMAGMALALKRAGADGVRVFGIEGEGGLTPGGFHEMLNSAWGLGLDNLYLMVDWNDFGIDPRPTSRVVYGTPNDWFSSHGWRVYGAEDGMDWAPLGRALLEAVHEAEPGMRPAAIWFRTRKGRGYGKYDYASHGAPHKMNSPEFWETKKPFQEKYGVRFEGFGEPAPESQEERMAQAEANYRIVMSVLRDDPELVRYLSDRLVELGESVPEEIPSLKISLEQNPFTDPELTDFRNYPPEVWIKPGEQAPNRKALALWGAWVNAWGKKKYGRPLFIAMSADLADSTNISGFAKAFGDFEGWGMYDREKNPDGALLPQEITEFANSGISVGAASVNFAADPEKEWNGFATACSTYGSFSYLKYGMMRLYSQMAQDCDFKLGPVLWVAGHSGPETADDSRTHFGIFAPSVTQLFPEGQVIDLHPWEANEVPVLIAAGLATGVPILALHLTRPPIEVPDREALGIPSHFEAARGAYVMRDYDPGKPRQGCVIVQGTTSTANLVKALPILEKKGLNVKIVAAVSPQLFARQDQAYRDAVLPCADKIDSMGITNRSRDSIARWMATRVSLEYTLSADWDDRWRTGGTLDDVVEEAKLTVDDIVAGIERFVAEREKRLAHIEAALSAARS